MSDNAVRLEEYERRSSGPLIAAAFVFLGLYAAQVLWLSAGPNADRLIAAGQVIIWIIFIADYAYRIYLAPHTLRYIAGHPLDIITLLLPMFRPLRALRIFAAARVLIDRGHHVSYGRVAVAIGTAALFIVFVGALAVLDYERFAPGATITTFGNALWWASVTITTVGYGDYSPVTVGGRMGALFMMAVGVSLLGAVTGTFAGWFTERIRGGHEVALADLSAQIEELRVDLLAAQRHSGQAEG